MNQNAKYVNGTNNCIALISNTNKTGKITNENNTALNQDVDFA